MLPIGDDNPTRITPVVNYCIIITCFVVFIWQSTGGYNHFLFSLYDFGVIPSRVLRGAGYYTFITSIFLHGSWSHLLGNMLFLWIFGDNIEDCCGHARYILLYLTSGFAASVFWFMTDVGAQYPAVGASGAISGVLGAYFVLYPSALIKTLVGYGFWIRVVRVPAYMMIGLWFIFQFFLALVPGNTGIAYWAHVGGFISGLLLAKIIKKTISPGRPIYDLESYR